jgi:hypothetical protein
MNNKPAENNSDKKSEKNFLKFNTRRIFQKNQALKPHLRIAQLLFSIVTGISIS